MIVDPIITTLSEEEVRVYHAIKRMYFPATYWKSKILRSPRLRMSEIADGFPDYLRGIVEKVVGKLTDDFHLLIMLHDSDGTRYALNPNKYDYLKKLLDHPVKPIEESNQLLNYKFAFEKEGSRTSKGIMCKYSYFVDPIDNSHYKVVIHSGSEKKKIIDLGSLNSFSILSQVWDPINKIQESFTKVDLESHITDRRIIQNRQPLRAAIDVLEYLGYIIKVGKRGRSYEYKKTELKPNIDNLDRYI